MYNDLGRMPEVPNIKFHENQATCKRTAQFEAVLLSTQEKIDIIGRRADEIFINQHIREIQELLSRNEIGIVLCQKLAKYKELADNHGLLDKLFYKNICGIISENSKEIAINIIGGTDFQGTMNAIRDYKTYSTIKGNFNITFYNNFIHDAYLLRAKYFLYLHKKYTEDGNTEEAEQNDDACRACISILENSNLIEVKEMFEIISQLSSFKKTYQ